MMKIKKAASLLMILGCALGGVCATSAAHPAYVMAEEAVSTSLQERINNAKEGDVISLEEDKTESIVIENGQNIILDLNGHTLSSAQNSNTIEVKYGGMLTIKNGNIQNTCDGYAAIFNNGIVSVLDSDVDIYGTNVEQSLIVNHGYMRLAPKKVSVNSTGYYPMIENGYDGLTGGNSENEYVPGVNHEEPRLEISGGNFDAAGSILVEVNEGSVLTVIGGMFDTSGGAMFFNSSGRITITGGIFNVSRGFIYNLTGDTWITGGMFNGDANTEAIIVNDGGTTLIAGGLFDTTQNNAPIVIGSPEDGVVIKGGTFEGGPAMRMLLDPDVVDGLLTDEDKARLDAEMGTDREYFLDMTEFFEGAGTDIKPFKQEAERTGYTASGVYDIKLLAKAVAINDINNPASAGEMYITKLKGGLDIEFSVEDLINTDENKNRTYSLVHLHDENGESRTEVIEGKFNKDTNTFTASVSSFSTFVLSYKDTDIEAQTNEPAVEPETTPVVLNEMQETSVAPKTGDTTNIFAPVMTLSIAAAGAIFALVKYKKSKEN